MELGLSPQIFGKNSNTKFHENPSSGNGFVPCGGTEARTDMMKLIVTFGKFGNALKKWFLECSVLEGDVDRKYTVQGTDKWRVVVNTFHELSVFIKCGSFLDWVWNCKLLNIGCAALSSWKGWHCATDYAPIHTPHHWKTTLINSMSQKIPEVGQEDLSDV